MPPSDTSEYLDRLEADLRLPGELTDDVLEEMEAHIADAIHDFVADGMARDDAEREVLRRLGPPEELGARFRRTHQTRRRLLAAVGGGAWQGIQAFVYGYLYAGLVIAIPAALGFALVSALVGTVFGEVDTGSTYAAFAAYVPLALWGGGWFAGRWIVAEVAATARRREADVRAPTAAVGFVLLVIGALLFATEHTWISVVLTLAIPFVFVASALTVVGDDEIPPPWLQLLSRMLGSLRRVLFAAFVAAMIVAIVGFAIAIVFRGPSMDSRPVPSFEAALQDRWNAWGFGIVAPTVVDAGSAWWAGGDDDRLIVELPNDEVDWDAWTDLHFEAWLATARRDGDGAQWLLPGTDRPYLVVPIQDPWSRSATVVHVGKPGVEAYLLFLVGRDPATGGRVAIGFPDGGETLFHGNLLDWFGSL